MAVNQHRWAQLFLFLRAQLTIIGVILFSTKQITLTEGTQAVPVPLHTDLLFLHQASPSPVRTSTLQEGQPSSGEKCWLNNCVQISQVTGHLKCFQAFHPGYYNQNMAHSTVCAEEKGLSKESKAGQHLDKVPSTLDPITVSHTGIWALSFPDKKLLASSITGALVPSIRGQRNETCKQ